MLCLLCLDLNETKQPTGWNVVLREKKKKKKRWTEYEWQPSLISFLSMEYFQQICCSSLAHSTHCRALPRKCQLTGWSIFDNLFILCSIRMFNTHCQVRRCLKQHSKMSFKWSNTLYFNSSFKMFGTRGGQWLQSPVTQFYADKKVSSHRRFSNTPWAVSSSCVPGIFQTPFAKLQLNTKLYLLAHAMCC